MKNNFFQPDSHPFASLKMIRCDRNESSEKRNVLRGYLHVYLMLDELIRFRDRPNGNWARIRPGVVHQMWFNSDDGLGDNDRVDPYRLIGRN